MSMAEHSLQLLNVRYNLESKAAISPGDAAEASNDSVFRMSM